MHPIHRAKATLGGDCMKLREQFETRYGKAEDSLFDHVLELALDDQKQYVRLSPQELDAVLDPVAFPPSNHDSERIDEIRERLLEAMGIIMDIVTRKRRTMRDNRDDSLG